MPKIKEEGDNMARPSKSISVSTGKISKKEKENRLEMELALKGQDSLLKPGSNLNRRQKQIFKFIVEQLNDSKILGNLDIFVVNTTAICIERLETLEKLANKDSDLILKSSFKYARDAYSRDFFRCCNELCLSPQARAKLSISASIPKNDVKKIKDVIDDDE